MRQNPKEIQSTSQKRPTSPFTHVWFLRNTWMLCVCACAYYFFSCAFFVCVCVFVLFLRKGRLGEVSYPLLFCVSIIKMKLKLSITKAYHRSSSYLWGQAAKPGLPYWFVFSISCNLMQTVCAVLGSMQHVIQNLLLFLHCLACIWKHLKEEFNCLNCTVWLP